jgi:hypothetical protein
MGYIEANLLPGETVIQRARLHWIVFLKALAVFVAGLGLLYFDPKLIGGVVMAFGLADGAAALDLACQLRVRCDEQARDHQGRRHSAPYAGAVDPSGRAISVDQSLSGRMLNYGTITLTVLAA